MGQFVKKIKNKQYGQAMVEFALTLPIFLVLVFGVIELSRFFLVYSSVYTASREASRFGASVGEGKETNFMNCSEIIQTAIRMGNFGGVQDNDVTVYYESSPGIFAGTCDESLEPVDRYMPKLGDRLVVEIETEFVSILGIVPNLPVRAVNGRTIMKSIVIERATVPVSIDKCVDKVSLVDSSPTIGEDDFTLSLGISNISTSTTYTISEIQDILWVGEPNLLEARWKFEKDDETIVYIIWKAGEGGIEAPTGEGLDLPTSPEPDVPDYWNQYLRNLYPETIGELEFIFDDDNEENLVGINLQFDVIMHHTNFPSDECDPVD